MYVSPQICLADFETPCIIWHLLFITHHFVTQLFLFFSIIIDSNFLFLWIGKCFSDKTKFTNFLYILPYPLLVFVRGISYFIFYFLRFPWYLLCLAYSPYKGHYRYLNDVHFNFFIEHVFSFLFFDSTSPPIFSVYFIFISFILCDIYRWSPLSPHKRCFFPSFLLIFTRYTFTFILHRVYSHLLCTVSSCPLF